MNTPIFAVRRTERHCQGGDPHEPGFETLYAYITVTKGIAYLIMAGLLVGLPLFWLFLTGNDEDRPTY
jgi:hypothetical protein